MSDIQFVTLSGESTARELRCVAIRGRHQRNVVLIDYGVVGEGAQDILVVPRRVDIAEG